MNKAQIDKYLEINPFEQLSTIVFNLFVEEIAFCNILPGTKLNISKIADDLSISRTPVREALNRLSEIGFVRIVNKGYYVSEFTSSDILKIYFIRTTLESKAAFLCAQIKNYPHIDYLKRLVNDFEVYFDNFEKITEIDYRFHNCIVLSCGNEYLIECYKLLENKFIRLQRQNLKMMLDNYKVVKIGNIATGHNAVINSIALNMPELAEKEMQNHMNSGLAHALLFSDSQ